MRKTLQAISLVFMVVGVVALFERPAYAYTDPGTGLLAIQAFGSLLVAAGWYLRRKIYALMHRGASESHDAEVFSVAKEGEGSPQP
ncbi:MAG: hypothetical protein ACRD27_00975 [Terracidiphilus sp.]